MGLRCLRPVLAERLGLLQSREVAEFYRKENRKGISYGSLYTTFRRMEERGWVRIRDDEDEDGRLRFFLITGHGERVLERSRAHYGGLSTFGLSVQAVWDAFKARLVWDAS